MIGALFGFLSFLTKGPLSRALDTVEKRIEAQNDKERIKGEIIKTHLETRADWMRSGGFILTLLFAVPLALWFSAVIIYSILWCSGCAYPQDWTIAALPQPLNQWAGAIILSIFGVVGLSRIR